MPDVVLGPPDGKGPEQATTDVVSLGIGGEIALSFGDVVIIDQPGPDLIVYENPFWIGGDSTMPFAELGEVSVSNDRQTWHTWQCDTDGAGPGQWPGCAGWTPTQAYNPLEVLPLDPELTGGDVFDLADLGVAEARFVRIRDLASDGMTPTAGFDLDAVGIVHSREESSASP